LNKEADNFFRLYPTVYTRLSLVSNLDFYLTAMSVTCWMYVTKKVEAKAVNS